MLIMVRGAGTERLVRAIIRLRQAELVGAPDQVGDVREDLEELVGPTVSRALAARVLGVSQTALDRHISAGAVSVVLTPSGRREVPLWELVGLAVDLAGCAGERHALGAVLRQLEKAGVGLVRRADHPLVEALEKAIANGRAVCGGITSWENRWYQRGILDNAPDGMSERARATLARAEAMTPDDYRGHLLARDQAQLVHAAIAPLADAAITLACPGPAPLWAGDVPGQPLAPRPTGDFVFNAPSSMLFAPAITLPLISVGGMPVGVQLMGQPHEDARLAGLARWTLETVDRVDA